MSAVPAARLKPLDPAKFRDPRVTAKGEARATVALTGLRTLWINTGTLCNLTCGHCYIESSPTNDRLEYLTAAEARAYFDEIVRDDLPTEEIGFTGGEPFMNPDIVAMLDDALGCGFRVLVLTNAMKPMMKCRDGLLDLHRRYGSRLTLRVSVDHYAEALHQMERGQRSWKPTMEGIDFLVEHGITLRVAGRTAWKEDELSLRQGYQRLFAEHGVRLDAANPAHLVLFPEMDATLDVPEITTACWGILKKSPDAMMCASSRMVVKRKGATGPSVVACTLLPYEEQFELGATLAEAARAVSLNHPHCAKFCVLGGASCSA